MLLEQSGARLPFLTHAAPRPPAARPGREAQPHAEPLPNQGAIGRPDETHGVRPLAQAEATGHDEPLRLLRLHNSDRDRPTDGLTAAVQDTLRRRGRPL